MSRRTFAAALLVCAVGVLAIAFGIDRAFGAEVTILNRLKSPAEQAEWRRLRDSRDAVAEIYGIVEPARGRTRVLLFRSDDSRLIVPDEDPAQRLLFVDRAAGDDVVFADQAWQVALPLAALLFLSGVLLLVTAWASARRARSGTAPSS